MKKGFYLILFLAGLYILLVALSNNHNVLIQEIAITLKNTLNTVMKATGLDYIIETFKEFI